MPNGSSCQKILVAIPAYQCAPQIARVIEEISQDHQLLNLVDQIVIIDNQSTDDTIAVACQTITTLNLSAKFKIISNLNNYGLGGSHKVAFNLANKENYDYVAILHGDNQAETVELKSLIFRGVRSPDLSAILGARFCRKSHLIGYSKLRIFGNLFLNILYSLVTFRITKDLGSGLNLWLFRSFCG